MGIQPHDKLFRGTFTQPRYAAELLRSLLPSALGRALDLRSLTVEVRSSIGRGLRERVS